MNEERIGVDGFDGFDGFDGPDLDGSDGRILVNDSAGAIVVEGRVWHGSNVDDVASIDTVAV